MLLPALRRLQSACLVALNAGPISLSFLLPAPSPPNSIQKLYPATLQSTHPPTSAIIICAPSREAYTRRKTASTISSSNITRRSANEPEAWLWLHPNRGKCTTSWAELIYGRSYNIAIMVWQKGKLSHSLALFLLHWLYVHSTNPDKRTACCRWWWWWWRK